MTPKIFEQNSILAWSSEVDYPAGSLVKLNGGGLIYASKVASGPSSSAGPQNPSQDTNNQYWTPVSLDDNNVVHKSGDEEISGRKIIRDNSGPVLILQNNGVTKGTIPSSTKYSQFIICDSNGISSHQNRIGFTEVNVNTDGSTIFRTAVCRNKANDFSYVAADLILPYDTTLRGYLNAPLYKDIVLVNNNIDAGVIPAATNWHSLMFTGKTNRALTGIWSNQSPGYTEISFRAYKNKDYDGTYVGFWVQFADDSTTLSNVSTDSFTPTKNKFSSLGLAGERRWGQIYSTSSTINTSDERKKTEINHIPDSILDAWGECEFFQYKMNDSVVKKGNKARYHTGMIAQRIKSKFESANKLIDEYGLFCYDEWGDSDARVDETGQIVEQATFAGNEYSIRYEEALCMEAAYQRRENRRLKEKVASLEERLANLESRLNIS